MDPSTTASLTGITVPGTNAAVLALLTPLAAFRYIEIVRHARWQKYSAAQTKSRCELHTSPTCC